MSNKTREIKEMTDDEFVKFLKKASKNFEQSAQVMETAYERGTQNILDFWKNR